MENKNRVEKSKYPKEVREVLSVVIAEEKKKEKSYYRCLMENGEVSLVSSDKFSK